MSDERQAPQGANPPAAAAPDELVRDLDVSVSESDAAKLTGGNKAKTADKAFNAMDAYIRG